MFKSSMAKSSKVLLSGNGWVGGDWAMFKSFRNETVRLNLLVGSDFDRWRRMDFGISFLEFFLFFILYSLSVFLSVFSKEVLNF